MASLVILLHRIRKNITMNTNEICTHVCCEDLAKYQNLSREVFAYVGLVAKAVNSEEDHWSRS